MTYADTFFLLSFWSVSCHDFLSRFPTLNRWIQMQTNLHRVSEFAIMADHTTRDGKDVPECKTAMKRFRDHDSDAESEVDELAGSNNISTNAQEIKKEVGGSSDPCHDSLKSESSDCTTVFLSFDCENEGPYEKAVERYSISFIFVLTIVVHIKLVLLVSAIVFSLI